MSQSERYFSDKLDDYLNKSEVDASTASAASALSKYAGVFGISPQKKPKERNSLSRAIDDWETVVGDYLEGFESHAMKKTARGGTHLTLDEADLSRRMDRLNRSLSTRLSVDAPRQAPQPQAVETLEVLPQSPNRTSREIPALHVNLESSRSSVIVAGEDDALLKSLDRSLCMVRQLKALISNQL